MKFKKKTAIKLYDVATFSYLRVSSQYGNVAGSYDRQRLQQLPALPRLLMFLSFIGSAVAGGAGTGAVQNGIYTL